MQVKTIASTIAADPIIHLPTPEPQRKRLQQMRALSKDIPDEQPKTML
jgi:hypothetical protein